MIDTNNYLDQNFIMVGLGEIISYSSLPSTIAPIFQFETLPRKDYFETKDKYYYFETKPKKNYFETD